jgi:hypothetical protein
MRIKKPFREVIDLDYGAVFAKPINKLHRKFDAKHGAEKVAAYCDFAVRVLRGSHKFSGPASFEVARTEFCSMYWNQPDLFLETMTTIRHHWYNASDTLKVQIFLILHGYITTHRGVFLPVEKASDGEISSAVDDYWENRISLATVKKARQLLSAKGK